MALLVISVVLKVLLYLLLGLLVLAFLFLVLPVRYLASGKKEDGEGYLEARGSVAAGLADFRFRLDSSGMRSSLGVLGFRRNLEKGTGNKKSRKTGPEAGRKKKQRIGPWLADPVLVRAKKLMLRLYSMMRPRECMVRGRVGAGDPAVTGWLSALYYGVSPLRESADIRLTPDFSGPVLEGEFRILGSLIPLQAAAYVLMFLLSGPVRKAYKLSKEEK